MLVDPFRHSTSSGKPSQQAMAPHLFAELPQLKFDRYNPVARRYGPKIHVSVVDGGLWQTGSVSPCVRTYMCCQLEVVQARRHKNGSEVATATGTRNTQNPCNASSGMF